MKRLKLFSAALAAMMPFAMALPAIAGQPAEASSDEQQGGKKKITVRTTGDSTAANQSEESNKRGWAQMFQQFLNENATVVNTAKSGTSSKSFYPEYWSQKPSPTSNRATTCSYSSAITTRKRAAWTATPC